MKKPASASEHTVKIQGGGEPVSARAYKVGPAVAVTVNPEGLGWALRVGREWVRDERGAIMSFSSAASAKEAGEWWRERARQALLRDKEAKG